MLRRLQDHLIVWLFAPLGRWLDAHADRFVAVLFHRYTRTGVAWLAALVACGMVLHQGWHAFDNANMGLERADGNSGHTTIDFGGQWMMGAMLVQGHGRELYNRRIQLEVLKAAYLPEYEDPKAEKRDAAKFLIWFMGDDNRWRDGVGSLTAPLAATDPLSAAVLTAGSRPHWRRNVLQDVHYPVGGPLYPPINAFLYSGLGRLPPQVGYRFSQLLNLFWAWMAALGIRYLTRGNIWCSVALLLIVVYPGFKGSLHLGQNAPLTLAIVTWGWALMAREHPIAGGMVWGLLAFKPVWGLAFFLAPLVTARWRACLAMVLTGGGLALLTLPFVGLRSWFNWLDVGHEASELYKVDYNWVFLSRDVLGIPRRWLLDFDIPNAQRDRPLAGMLGWALLGFCLGMTVFLALLRPRQARQPIGVPAGFILLGAWLTCFHFMYYDMLLTVLPIFVLLAEPKKLLEPICLALVPLNNRQLDGDDLRDYYGPYPADRFPPQLPWLQPGYQQVWVLNRMVPYVLVALIAVEHGFEHWSLGGTWHFYSVDGSRKITTHFDEHGDHISYRKHRLLETVKDKEDGSEGYIYRRVGQVATFRLSTRVYDDGEPWDTYCILFLWAWSGGVWLLSSPSRAPPHQAMTGETLA
ncbi:MAG: DUF2029 domain-containing protein [Planctomycetia bacterium]|nr:DUF2029 domain-containing protein [Planctomycetia bacterium]